MLNINCSNTRKPQLSWANNCDLFFFCVGFFCARIDNNRREYSLIELHSCAYMRVCSVFFLLFFFFNFYCTSFFHNMPRIAKSNPLLRLLCCFFWLCENRQQPTWIFRSPNCTVVHTCVCAPFFSLFFYLLVDFPNYLA